ncbi:MAG: hypothetical protein D6797_01055 [Bdellovibrio sp.]|nr:MAG: hypothetical protein D6797_01055 [Bdellovibrio sp.]
MPGLSHEKVLLADFGDVALNSYLDGNIDCNELHMEPSFAKSPLKESIESIDVISAESILTW